MSDSRIESIFSAALQKGSHGEREAYLDGACHYNADLRARVETLLRAHDEAGGFLARGETGIDFAEDQGTMIDRYKLLQRIGEGGFGVVYMAEQVAPVRRKVALKIIKLGMDTKQVVARFESERQALALMDHPNIARVLDAGATESGRPYFVMELVKGIAITEYCDQNELTLRERLNLFLPICQAVQHAHQKGIIHRDIKPSNVLVTLHDGTPVPKVIDFGIAKATNQRLTEKTLFTEFRQFIGTPQYMSPEQAEMSGLDVDTRSDIYSLGVLLYELLTGTTPFEGERLRTAGYPEMQRIIREEDPPSPSQRVSTMGDQLATVAKRRQSEAELLPKDVRGDLDWIVMKALEKDRTRRYATANDLAADVHRYMAHELVLAGPPSRIYKFKKFVRRNRLAALAAGTVAAALLVGLLLAGAGFLEARREAARSQAIADFLQEILSASDPQAAAARNIDVASVAARSRELFGDDHATVASTLASLGMQLERSGKLDAAEQAYRESIQLWRGPFGDEHAQVGITLGRLGHLLHMKGDDSAAETALREAIKITDSLPGAARLVAADARTQLAAIAKQHSKLAEAETLLRESLQIRRSAPAGQEYFIAADLESLVGVLSLAGKNEPAEKLFEEMLTAYRPLFPADSLPLAWQNAAYGIWLRQRGKGEKAEPYLREAVRIYRLSQNPPRDIYLATLDGLFQCIRRREEAVDETITVFNECMENMAYVYGRDHLLLAPHLIGFARELENRKRYAEAIPLLIEGIRISRKSNDEKRDPNGLLDMLERFVFRVAASPGQPQKHYETARQGAVLLVAERGSDTFASTLLGIAQYRLANWSEAEKNLSQTLRPSDSAADKTASKSNETIRLAFLAMAQFQSHTEPLAKETLEQMREQMQEAQKSPDQLGKEIRAVVSEAESLVARSAGNTQFKRPLCSSTP